MSLQSGPFTLTTTGATPATGIATLTKDPADLYIVAVLSGTFTGLQVKFLGVIGTNTFPIQANALSDGSVANGTQTISDATTTVYQIMAADYDSVQVYVVAIATNSVVVNGISSHRPKVQNTLSMTSSAMNPPTNDGAALGSTSLQWSDLFLAEGGVINWDNGDVTITQTNNVLAVGGITSFTINTGANLNNAANDGGSLGTTALGWSDLFLATGGVINWANGEVTITETDANTLTFAGASTGYIFDAKLAPSANDGAAIGVSGTAWSDLFLASGAVINFNAGNVTMTHAAGSIVFAGATVFQLGAVTLNVTGTRIVQSYHTNITSTNDVTVDSSILSKIGETVKSYDGDALAVINGIDVVSFEHRRDVDPTGVTKLGVIAETVREPLALRQIEDPAGGHYPGVGMMGLIALQTRAIQQLTAKVDELRRNNPRIG